MFRFISAWLQAVLRYIAAWLQAATADDSDAAVALPQAAMDFPVTASLGPLHRPLHSFRATKNNLPDGVSEGEVRRLEADLEVLFTELKIVAEADDPSFTARCWMKEVRELRYDAEDFFNEVPRSSAGAGRSALLAVILWIPSKLKRRRQVAAAFSDLCARAKEASPRRQSFQLGPVTIKPVFGQANVSHSPKFIGLEESMDKLVKMLTFDSEGAEQQVQVVAIFGLAGVGKTTLARTFYRDFGGKYQCQAFVRVSRNPDTRMLLSSILSQIKAPLVHAFPDVQDLIDHIREYLRCKRYLIVIDDLWASSTWDVISRAFPDGDCCSRIIVTTEIEDVALACSRYQFKYIYEMGPLNGDQSRKLFLGRVFGSEDGCPPDFKDVAYEISRKCGGLPLATENIASMLACELDIDQWKYVRDSLPSILSLRTNPGSEGLKEVLNIIYSNLSPKLKTCLLYLTMYPEGYTISKDELVKQWVAEDFIGEGQDREKTARDYFDELVSRGMIQPVDRNYNDDVLTFTVHHMVLDLIRYKSLEENFIISVSCFQTTPGLPDKVRRLSVQFGGAKCANMPADFMMTQVRSLIFFGFLNCVPSFVEYKVLRVLILHIWADGSKIFDLTRIGELFQLRCLKIDCNITVHLPDEIRQLNSLETLELHAPVNGMPSDISCLPLLRTLGYFDLSKNSLENVWSLGELNNLQDLHLTWSNIAEPDNLKNNMQCLRSILWKLSNLKSLTLVPAASSDAGVLDNAAGASVGISGDVLSSVSSPPALLQRLELSGRCCIFSSLPEWTKELGNLCILKIAVRKLLRKDIDILKGLPALMALSLYVWTAPVGKIVFDNEGFSVLKYFKFTCAAPCAAFLKGAMPSVRQLKLAFNGNRMEQYSQIVAGLEYLIELKEITAKVGGTGADESDKRYVESALSGAIANHPCTPIIRVRCVDRIFCGEEDTSAATQEQEHWTLEKRHNKQEELLNPLPELISIPSTQTQTRDGGKNGGTERSREASAPPTAAMRRGRADAPADLGSVLGHPTPDLRNLYALGRKLGQGQFSTTYVCTELATGVEYACKSISKHKLIKEDIDDVRREIQIMHHLSGHKNVVAIKGAYEDQCYVHIVMELCAGGELFDRIIQRGHYSELKAVELTRIIVGVIEACHSLGVMHRDLKPENFLLANKDDDLSLKAIDFGLSVFFKPGQIFTDVVGSPYYIAPEVLGRKYGQEADLWTAGVILYILLSGVPPFWAETQQGIFDAILKGVIDFDSEPWPVISDSAKDLIRRMLNPRPAERLTAQEVLCHPWIRDHGVAPDRPLDRAVLSRIKHFSAMNKLKKMALRVIAESLSEEEIAGLKEMFQTMDTDNSGAITYDELKEGLRRYGSTLKDTEIRDLMEAADVDNSGTIDYMEFIAATLHLNKLEREEHLVAAFSYFDKDGSGYIRVDELQQACQEHNMPDAFLDDSIKEADQDNSLATPTKSGPRGGSRGKVVDEVNLMVVYEPTKPQENCKSREDTNMPAEEVPEAKKRKIAESTSGKEKLVSSENAEASLVRYKGSNSSTRGHCTEQTEQCKFYPPQSFSRHYPTNTTYLGKRSRAVDVASGAMGSLLDKLGKLVKGNYNLERSMKRDIESFSEDLAKIHIDLPYLEKLDGVEIWVDEVRELSYNIEDMVDSFMVRVEPDSSRSGFRELPHEGLKFLENDMTTQRQIGDVIKDIKNQVQAMVDRKKKYNFDVNNVVATATAKAPIDPRMAIYINKEQLIGIEERIDQLIRLFEEDGDVSKQELKTIFIVGMGGLGKTTLAKAVYDKLKKDYHHRAFIPVGQNPDVKKVLMDILFEFGQKSENLDLDVHQLIKKLRKLLKKERYFIVIDDIWDSSSWDLIASAFPKNNHGSRVITTTRIERVARACCEHERKYVYRMKPLSEEESRRLFLRRIFGHGKDCPDTPRKEEISKYILKKCGGMPLAINSIASLLGEEESTWEYIWKSLASVTEGNDLEKMKQILDLSYMHLPSDLKTCLLYVCMYPEDREIYKDDLLRLWVAEGFVSANSGPDAEDVANKYFNDLISTSMIQPGERDAYNNEVLSCRVHDIMLDLLRSKSSEENFIRVIDGSKYGTGKIRRVSFHNNDKNYMRIFETINKESLSQVRSVLLCQSSLAAYFLEKFKYVRVLHLERDNGFNHSLDLTGISKLFLLRYLKIACPHGGMCELKLPNQIGELQQLETIDLQGCYMEKYPSDIVSLPWLSHLSMTGIIAGVVLPDGIDRLTSLRTLAGVRLYESSVDSILGLGKLTNLRKLEICLYTGRGEAITARHMDALRSSISILSTNLMICTFRERFPLKYVLGWSSRTLFPGDSQIRELHLGGCIFRRCPKCIRQLHKLYKFSIWVREVADGISIVAGLRSLAYFSLMTCNIWAKRKEEREICVWEEGKEERVVIPGTGSGAFQALKEFIFCCKNASLTFEAGAMPKLERLEIEFRYHMTAQFLPVDIQHLPAPTVKQICLRVAHNDMEVEGSQDWNSDDRFNYYLSDEYVENLRQHDRTVRALLMGAFKPHYPGADIVIQFEEGFDEEEDDENEDETRKMRMMKMTRKMRMMKMRRKMTRKTRKMKMTRKMRRKMTRKMRMLKMTRKIDEDDEDEEEDDEEDEDDEDEEEDDEEDEDDEDDEEDDEDDEEDDGKGVGDEEYCWEQKLVQHCRPVDVEDPVDAAGLAALEVELSKLLQNNEDVEAISTNSPS